MEEAPKSREEMIQDKDIQELSKLYTPIIYAAGMIVNAISTERGLHPEMPWMEWARSQGLSLAEKVVKGASTKE